MHKSKFPRPCDLEALQDLADAIKLLGAVKQATVLRAAVAELCILRAYINRRDRIDLERRRGGYETLGMRALRDQADGLCSDPECALSGGFAHAGPCEPCSCSLEHAQVECPVDKVHAMNLDHGSVQCGAVLQSAHMTFRNTDGSISERVTCEGCIAVEGAAEEEKEIPPMTELEEIRAAVARHLKVRPELDCACDVISEDIKCSVCCLRDLLGSLAPERTPAQREPRIKKVRKQLAAARDRATRDALEKELAELETGGAK